MQSVSFPTAMAASILPEPPSLPGALGAAEATVASTDATAAITAAAPHGPSGVVPSRPSQDIFISYAWRPEDKISPGRSLFYGQRRAHTLARALRRAGYTVWLDTDNMAREATHCAFAAMGLGIRRAKAVVFCVSPEYMQSGSCRTEAHFAREAGKEHRFIVK